MKALRGSEGIECECRLGSADFRPAAGDMVNGDQAVDYGDPPSVGTSARADASGRYSVAQREPARLAEYDDEEVWELRELDSNALNNLPDCQQVFQDKAFSEGPLTLQPDQLQSEALGIAYYDVTDDSEERDLTIGEVSPPASDWADPDMTLGEFADAQGGDAVTLFHQDASGNVQTLPITLLKQGFYDATSEQQGVLLVHELLHYALNMNDDQIQAYFGYDPADYVGDPLTAWLTSDCE